MNACIFFNRSYVFWHAIALDLSRRYGVENISAYVYGKKPYEFLLKQTDIQYRNILVDDILAVEAADEVVDDEWLKAKEKEYGIPFFWQNFTADRVMVNNWPRNFYLVYQPIFNHYQIKQQLQFRIKKIEEMLSRAKPDFIVMNGAGAMGVNLLCQIGQKKGIKTIVIETPRLGNKVGLTASLYGLFPHIEEKFKKLKSGQYKTSKKEEAIQWLEKFRKTPIKPFWSNPAEQFTSIDPVLFLKNLVRNIIVSFDKSFPRIYSYSVADYLRRNYLMFTNRYRFPKYDTVDFTEDYTFFPLHYEPELALMMYAPFYTDQLWLIRNIAQSLPLHFKFYIKEHPAMLTLRDPKFYKELKKIPNVKLLDPGTSSIPIIKNSKLVTVITSTAGWEGAFFRKPVISFGNILFNVLPAVKRCKAIEELPLMVKDCLENYNHNEDELVNLISVILENSFDVDLPKMWIAKDYLELSGDKDLNILVDEMIKFFKSGLAQNDN